MAIPRGQADEAAVARVLAGETEAFRDLVTRHQSALLAFVGKLLAVPQDREDVVQEAFLAAFRNLALFDPRRGTFGAWIFRIARNRALNALKRKRPVTLESLPEAGRGNPSPEPAAFAALDRALAALPTEQRTAFLLAELHGFTYGEVAGIEGVRLGTVKSRIARARAALRAALGAVVERER